MNYYEQAVSAYERELSQLRLITDKVNSQDLLARLLQGDAHKEAEWLQSLEGWPESTESRVFTRLITDRWFRATLMNYQDLRSLKNRLNTWNTILDVYEQMLLGKMDNLEEEPDALVQRTLVAPQVVGEDRLPDLGAQACGRDRAADDRAEGVVEGAAELEVAGKDVLGREVRLGPHGG